MRDPKSILIVDDDPDVVLGVRTRLHAAGYQTITRKDGKGGIDAALEQRPDAVVMDLRLPDMNGITAVERLRQHETTRNIPIVVLSASLAAQQRALDAGARFFVSKPYGGPMLLQALETAIRDATTPTVKEEFIQQ